MMLSRPGATLARGALFAFLRTISVALCTSPWTQLIAWCIPPVMQKDVELDHFDTQNSPAGMCLHHCICCTTLQFSNNDPKGCTNFTGSRLILSCRVQYNDWLFLAVLELWSHCNPLIDPTRGEPFLMEMVGDFKATDLIFKGCYRDSLLYSDTDLCWLRQQKILPVFQEEIPVPPAPCYRQVREPVVAKQSPHRVAALDAPAESPKAKHSSSKSGPQ